MQVDKTPQFSHSLPHPFPFHPKFYLFLTIWWKFFETSSDPPHTSQMAPLWSSTIEGQYNKGVPEKLVLFSFFTCRQIQSAAPVHCTDDGSTQRKGDLPKHMLIQTHSAPRWGPRKKWVWISEVPPQSFPCFLVSSSFFSHWDSPACFLRLSAAHSQCPWLMGCGLPVTWDTAHWGGEVVPSIVTNNALGLKFP